MYGRNQISGTYEFFKQLVLYGGDFKEAVKQEVGSEAVVESVGKNKFAIGYSGIGYKTSGVRAFLSPRISAENVTTHPPTKPILENTHRPLSLHLRE